MKTSFRKTFKLFTYLSILFTVIFWIYMINDDYVFVEKYGIDVEDIQQWFMWYLGYFLGFTFYFWVISSLLIIMYHQIIKRN
jgi:hypothetical protein